MEEREIKKTTHFKAGDPVVYIAQHVLDREFDRRICLHNLGRVKRVNDTCVFVEYFRKTIQGTDPIDLFHLTNRPDLIDILDGKVKLIDDEDYL